MKELRKKVEEQKKALLEAQPKNREPKASPEKAKVQAESN